MSFDSTDGQGPTERVNYATGMMLSAEDFRAEQSYHRNRLAKILRFALGTGTLAGLAVQSEGYRIIVSPGLAIDAFGQLIEVTCEYSIDLKRWVECNADFVSTHVKIADMSLAVDVVLSARDIGRAKTPSFADGPFDALDAVVASRFEDGFLLELIASTGWPQSVAAATPRQQVLEAWKSITAKMRSQKKQVILAQITLSSVTKIGSNYTIPAGASIEVKDDLRPIINLVGKSLA